MTDLNIMYDWLMEFQAENQKLIYKKDDVRKNFLDFLYDVANNYYQSFMMIEFTYLLKEHLMRPDGELKETHAKHFKKALILAEDKDIYQSYYNSLNRTFLLSTWMSFEVSVTTFCDFVLNEKEKTDLYKWKYIEIEKKLKKYDVISDSDKNSIEKIVFEKHLSHVPIERKVRILHDKCKNYTRNWNDNGYSDLSFLKFFGEYRNTSHSNFIYFKKDGFTYNFKDKATFTFENGKVVEIDSTYEVPPQLFFDILTEFKNIWLELISKIEVQGDIPYPIEDSLIS